MDFTENFVGELSAPGGPFDNWAIRSVNGDRSLQRDGAGALAYGPTDNNGNPAPTFGAYAYRTDGPAGNSFDFSVDILGDTDANDPKDNNERLIGVLLNDNAATGAYTGLRPYGFAIATTRRRFWIRRNADDTILSEQFYTTEVGENVARRLIGRARYNGTGWDISARVVLVSDPGTPLASFAVNNIVHASLGTGDIYCSLLFWVSPRAVGGRIDSASVTAYTPDSTAPIIATPAAVLASGNQIDVTHTEDGSPPLLPNTGVTGYSVSGFSGGAVTVTGAVRQSALVMRLTLSRVILVGETGGLLAYTPGNVTDSALVAMVAQSGIAITNGSGQLPTVATPTASPVSGSTVATGGTVALACATSAAQVHYTMTTDGSTPADPTSGSTLFTGPIAVTVPGTTRIKAIGIKTGNNNSGVALFSYTVTAPTVATPTFDPVSGSPRQQGEAVAIACATSGANVRWIMTTDGSTPADPTPTTGTVYTGPIVLSVPGPVNIKAIAYKAGSNNSAIPLATYTVTPVTAPDFSAVRAPSSLSLVQGESGQVVVAITRLGGNTAAIGATLTGLPNGVTVGQTPANPTTGNTITILFSAAIFATIGPATALITLTDGTNQRVLSVALTIVDDVAPEPTTLTIPVQQRAFASESNPSGTGLAGSLVVVVESFNAAGTATTVTPESVAIVERPTGSGAYVVIVSLVPTPDMWLYIRDPVSGNVASTNLSAPGNSTATTTETTSALASGRLHLRPEPDPEGPIVLFVGDNGPLDIFLEDEDGRAISTEGATLSARLTREDTRATVASPAVSVLAASHGLVRATIDATNLAPTTYRLTIARTSGGTTRVFGPLRIRVETR